MNRSACFATAALLALSAVDGQCRAADPLMPVFAVTTEKPTDRVGVKVDRNAATFDATSPSGIGGATITRTQGDWPAAVAVRLHLHGLEHFEARADAIHFTASVLSHSGHAQLLRLDDHGQEQKLGPETKIEAFDASGRRINGLPYQGGYFEIRLPSALFAKRPKSLTLGWIDFFRH